MYSLFRRILARRNTIPQQKGSGLRAPLCLVQGAPTVFSWKNCKTPFGPVPEPYSPSLSVYMSLSALGRFEGVLGHELGQRPLDNKDRWILRGVLV